MLFVISLIKEVPFKVSSLNMESITASHNLHESMILHFLPCSYQTLSITISPPINISVATGNYSISSSSDICQQSPALSYSGESISTNFRVSHIISSTSTSSNSSIFSFHFMLIWSIKSLVQNHSHYKSNIRKETYFRTWHRYAKKRKPNIV